MVHPVVALPNQTLTGNMRPQRSSWHVEKTGRTKQKAPYTVVTPYTLLREFEVDLNRSGPIDGVSLCAPPGTLGTYGIDSLIRNVVDYTAADNKAYDKFRNAVKANDAMLAVNLVERKQAVDALATRLKQLALFTFYLKRGNLQGVLYTLGLTHSGYKGYTYKPVRGKPNAKDARKRARSLVLDRSTALSQTWLEYHFGWDPLIKDISSSIGVLSQSPYKKYIRVKAGVDQSGTYRRDYNGKRETVIQRWKAWSVTYVGCEVEAENSALQIANQLGLINPASIAWELVPFSFVVDWFTGVGTWINSWTDFVGYKLSNAWTTRKSIAALDFEYFSGFYNSRASVRQEAVRLVRSTSLPSYKLAFKPLKFSPIRGATAISLLVSQLRSINDRR